MSSSYGNFCAILAVIGHGGRGGGQKKSNMRYVINEWPLVLPAKLYK